MDIEITVDEMNSGIRLDKCIAEELGEEYSRTFARKLIDQGDVDVNGKQEKPSYIVQAGDKVSVIYIPPQDDVIEAENISLNIVYEDDWVAVIDKPFGMVVHPGAGNRKGTLVNALLYKYKKLGLSSSGDRPGIVHRLDKDTSGLVVIARNDKALRLLTKQFQRREVEKKYIALVKGVIPADNGIINAPIARSDMHRKEMAVSFSNGKPAETIFHVLKRFEDFTVVRIELKTGRTHQIRVHMKHIGHPVLGDKVYGTHDDLLRQALHAEQLGFMHPYTKQYMEFRSPVPDDMIQIIKRGRFLQC